MRDRLQEFELHCRSLPWIIAIAVAARADLPATGVFTRVKWHATVRPFHRFPLRFAALAALALWGSAALAEHYMLPLFVTSTTAGTTQGVLRLLNDTGESGSVEIHAIDDAGTRTGPATFTLNAWTAMEFDASELASGNAMKGLSEGLGTLSGDVRLAIETELQIVPSAYVRAADGTLSAMHDTVRASVAAGGGGGYRYLVPIFNSASEVTQSSRLRLINPGDRIASITIEGRDDTGAAATGGTVQLTLPAGGGRTLTAQQLEAGDTGMTGQAGQAGLTGRLGAGVGRWRLSVSSDRSIQVVNVVSATSGYMNNLSTTAVPGAAPAGSRGVQRALRCKRDRLQTGQRPRHLHDTGVGPVHGDGRVRRCRVYQHGQLPL